MKLKEVEIPQIPQFVADWIDSAKKRGFITTNNSAYRVM